MTNSTTSKELRSEIFRWWERGITYPRLFKDRNNDGIRDLEGIRSKLASMPFPQFDVLVELIG